MSISYATKSFYDYIKRQCEELLPSVSKIHLTSYVNMIFMLYRRSKTILPYGKYEVVETNSYKQCLLKISDKQILAKINILKNKLEYCERDIFDPSKNKIDRFVTDNFIGFFDKKGMAVTDFLLDTANIMHFHIGYNKLTSDTLLFAYVKNFKIYLIFIGKHSDLYFDIVVRLSCQI